MKDWKERMEESTDPRVAAYFRCIGHAIAAEQSQENERFKKEREEYYRTHPLGQPQGPPDAAHDDSGYNG